MKQVCDDKSVPYFDCFHESGITEENQAKYLSDGLHPNEAGKVLHAKYIIRKLDETDSALSIIAPEAVRRESVAISSTVLTAGESLSVRSLKDGISLVEAVLYDATGSNVFRKSVPDIKYTLPLPALAGIYVLNVRLADSTSETFKILVK
jgi:hypothetical protein